MEEIKCPQCKKLLKDSAARLVQDSCGHKKCRLCLLQDEAACHQCFNGSQASHNDCTNKNNQTTVITCNKFFSPSKVCSNDNSQEKHQCNTEVAAEVQTELSKNKDKNEKSKVKKRKYNFFSLPTHITLIKEDGDLYKCTVCNKTFHTKYYVNNHKYCIEGKKPFSCDKCKKSFVTKSQLEAHCLVHLDITPHTCTICNKSFKEKSKLNRHKLTHTNTSSYVCQTCGKSFRSKEYLKTHFYIHEEVKPFKCKTCGIKLSNSSNLKKHLSKHSKEKNHMCDQCGKRFKLKWSLTVHRRSHVRIRNQKCAECNKTFINAKELRRHVLTHLDLKPYSCSLCETTFRRKDNLERHVKNTHPGKKVIPVVKNNVEELVRNKLNSIKTTVNNSEPIKENPNAIKVITNSNFNRLPPVVNPSSTVNAPLKLAFKTKAFKSHYNIHGREYPESTAALQPRPYDAAESVNICKKILSPYTTPTSSTSVVKSPVHTPTSETSDIYEKFFNSTPVDNSQPRPYGIIKFKLPSNYKNILRNDQPTKQPLQSTDDVPNFSSLTTYDTLGHENEKDYGGNELPCATSVIVNSPYIQKT